MIISKNKPAQVWPNNTSVLTQEEKSDQFLLERIKKIELIEVEKKPLENVTVENPADPRYDSVQNVIENYLPPVQGLYPSIAEPSMIVPDYVPRTLGPVVVLSEPQKPEYTSNAVSWFFTKRPIYQDPLDTLNRSLSGKAVLSEIDKSLIAGYPVSVRRCLSEHADIESKIALFEDAIKSALWAAKTDKVAYEKELRSGFYECLISEERAKIYYVALRPDQKEGNFALLLQPIKNNLEKIKELSGNKACNPLKDLYSAFREDELRFPMNQLYNVYLMQDEASWLRPVLKIRWQQLAEIYEVVAAKPGLALGEPEAVDLFSVKSKNKIEEKKKLDTEDFFVVSSQEADLVVEAGAFSEPNRYTKSYIEVYFQKAGIRPEGVSKQKERPFGLRYRLTKLAFAENPWAYAYYEHKKRHEKGYDSFSDALSMEKAVVKPFLKSYPDQKLIQAVHNVVQASLAEGNTPEDLQEEIAKVPASLFADEVFNKYLIDQALAENVAMTDLDVTKALHSPIIVQAMVAWFDHALSAYQKQSKDKSKNLLLY